MGISYTEREYDYALQQNKPVMGFLHREPDNLPVKHTDQDPSLRLNLNAFRKK
jgi:hypothetical protein